MLQINPHVRLPRTFARFCGLIVQLLQKLSIRASNGPEKLLKVFSFFFLGEFFHFYKGPPEGILKDNIRVDRKHV